MSKFVIKSPEFDDDNFIPSQFTYDGKNLSPSLYWEHPPAGTASFTLILEDRNSHHRVGKTLVHWVVINLPASVNQVVMGLDVSSVPNAEVVTNDFGVTGYTGPCIEPCASDNSVHQYRLTLFAMKVPMIGLNFCLTARQFSEFYRTQILDSTRINGKFVARITS